MGPGENATKKDVELAYNLGKKIAENHYILLNGGRNVGVMEASSKGARVNNGVVIGILPGNTKEQCSEFITVPIITGIGNARNSINILTSDIIVAIGRGAGTYAEIALALKLRKPLILAHQMKESRIVFSEFKHDIYYLDNANEIIEKIDDLVGLP